MSLLRLQATGFRVKQLTILKALKSGDDLLERKPMMKPLSVRQGS
jgi:hypothetical protein